MGDIDRKWDIYAGKLRSLWELASIPEWHCRLYEARYLSGGSAGARYHPELLQQEVQALLSGTALVQVAQKAIEARDEVLSTLRAIRERHTDAEFQAPKSAPARNLLGMLCQLRVANVAAVEALSAWRRSVAPVPGREVMAGTLPNIRPSTADAPRGSAAGKAAFLGISVAGPGARGACWPSGGADYLQVMLDDTWVSSAFRNVVAASLVADPFMACSAPEGGGKLRLPPPARVLATRIEAAKLLLVEDDLSSATLRELLSGQNQRAASKDSQNMDRGHQTPRMLPSPRLHLLQPAQVSQRTQNKPKGLDKHAKSNQPRSPFVVKRPRSEPPGKQRPPSRQVLVLEPPPEAFLPETKAEGDSAAGSLAPSASSSRLHASTSQQSRRTSRFRHSDGTPKRRMSAGQVAESARDFMQSMQQQQQVAQDAGSTFSALALQVPTVEELAAGNGQELPAAITVFKKFQHDRAVHHDDMDKALRLLGVQDPVPEWIDEVWSSVTEYSTVTLEEFIKAIAAYEEREKRALTETFKQFDTDGSGSIQAVELAEVLKDLSIEPMRHVLQEIINEVDHDGSGEIELEEFFEVMHSLQERQGFALTEYEGLLDAFERFDVDGSGEVDGQELAAILNYLGYTTSPSVAEQIVQEVDIDGSGNVGVTEFLTCMRHVRDTEVAKLKQAVSSFGKNHSCHWLGVPELEALLCSLSYFPEHEVVTEVCGEIGLDLARGAYLDFSSLWQFLHVYRKREGLSAKDDMDVKAAFMRYVEKKREKHKEVVDEDGEVTVHNVGKILRYMGYIVPFEEQQLLIHAVDIDKSGSLSILELRKIVRMCRQRELMQQQLLFEQLDKDSDGHISLHEFNAAMQSGLLGKLAGTVYKNSVSEGAGLDLPSFMRFSRVVFEKTRRAIRSSGGFTGEELRKLRENFQLYDKDNSGDICNEELCKLVEDVFKDMASSAEYRPVLDNIIQEADVDQNGRLDFEDFCRLMRSCYDLRERQHLAKERQIIARTGFSQHEVNEFREIFVGVVSDRQKMNVGDFKKLIATLLQLRTEKAEELVGIFHDVVPNADEASFADFLVLMYKVLDTNFGGVKERTAAYAVLNQPNQSETSRPSAAMTRRRTSIRIATEAQKVPHEASLLPAADDGSHRRRRKSTWATATGGSANMLPD